MLFWWICGGQSFLPVLLLRHLGSSSRIDAFELWCWRRLLRVPWTSRRSNQFILKEISPRISLEGMTLKLATSCEELTHWKRPWCWEGLGAGGEGDDRGWDGWMASLTRWTWVWVNPGSWWWTGRAGVLDFGVAKSRTRLSDRTELNWKRIYILWYIFENFSLFEEHKFKDRKHTGAFLGLV